ncbi:MAG: V-type ATP synthase subunit F [Clostridia bacterium]|nr:V-type ATP synthase subunit F [Clostridia bacterium]MBR3144588.1 V-type ATP synthase subunit F [Clostridia bacterium]
MYKAAVVGDKESIYGFAAVGLTTKEADENTAGDIVEDLVKAGYGVIYVTENLAFAVEKQMEKYRAVSVPAIILIPGVKDNTGEGVANVHRFVEKAVGSDILKE